MSCFNVSPQFAESFNLPKTGRGWGDFTLGYLHAAFDKDGEFGEFYIEFEEQVWQKRVAERFEELGARQVSLITFDKKCKKAAFARVLELGRKTGIKVVRGTIPADLEYMTQPIARTVDAEFDEKTQNAIRASLAEVDGKVERVYGSVSEVRDGVTQVIELQRSQNMLESDNRRLIAELKRVNLLRDQLEQKVAKETEYRNKYEASLAANAGLERTLEAVKEKLNDRNKIIAMWEGMWSLNGVLGSAQKLLNCSQASYQDAIATMHRINEEERACKRARQT